MGFLDKLFKCSICGEKFGRKHYEIANYEGVCHDCYQLAKFSKIDLIKTPMRDMTANEVRIIIFENKKLQDELGEIKENKVLSLLRSAKKSIKEEKILYWIYGVYKTKSLGNDAIRNAAFIATHREVFFYAERVTGFETESFPFSNITSVEIGKGFLGPKVNIIVSGNSTEIFGVTHGQITEFTDYVRAKITRDFNGNVSLQFDSADQLRKYKMLLDDGIISEEEFNLKKKKILEL